MNVLLLHVPKLEDFYLPFGRYMNVNYLPMGLVGIAHHLAAAGHRVELVHAGVEKILDSSWTASHEAISGGWDAVGLDLHWHYQAYDVARAVERIRAARPGVKVFLGGLTASWFGREVLETWPGVDAVVLGEGFEPARLLLAAWQYGGSLSSVPNLAWRDGERVVVNPQRMLHDVALFDRLPFADLTPLRHHQAYAAQFGFPLAYGLELTPLENRQRMTMGRAFFPLFVGSGCRRACSWCGGSSGAQRRMNGLHRVLWRGHDAVLRDVARARDFGYRTLALCFDPLPESTAWYVELFRRMRAEAPDMDLYFECWGLPEPAFMDAFAQTFAPPHSYLALSPDTGDEEVRARHKAYPYSNQELLATARHLEARGVQLDVFFSLGLPGETAARALRTRELVRRFAGLPNVRRLMTWAVQLEPGSPAFEDPARFGIEVNRRTLADFEAAHGTRGDAYSVLGYRLPGYFGDARDLGGVPEFEAHFQQFKCQEFCFHSADPRVYNDPAIGRQACLDKRRFLALRRGLPSPDAAIGPGCTYDEACAAERPLVPRVEV